MTFETWKQARFYRDSGIPEPELALVRFCEEAWEAGVREERERCAKISEGAWSLTLLGQYSLLKSGMIVSVDTSPLADQIRKGE